ncbi:MAG TPA: hypothetical protein VFS34_04345 [Thermoanaerobaculia bacterium]|nr:hypothetical protein [Thermoanaerobaculia bacterium]
MSGRFRKSRRAVVWALAILVALLAVLVATPSFVVRRGLLLRWMSAKPEKLRLTYASASAPWPGKIEVTGLELRGSDPNVQWWFRMERAEIRYSILDLLARKFHATSVRASGLRFRLRQRLPAAHAAAADRAPLPPIPGFGEVPVKGGPPFFPPPEEPGHYWQVQIDDLDAPGREIWFDAYRYEGDVRVAGAFFLWPQKRANVGPARVEFGGGTVQVGRNVAARSFRATVAGKIAPFDPRAVRGNEVYRFVSGKARASGEMPGVAFLDYYLRDSPEPRLSGGKGKIEGNLELRNGRGSLSATLAADGARAAYRKRTLSGAAVVRLRMDDWRPGEAEGALHGTTIELADISTSPGAGEAARSPGEGAKGSPGKGAKGSPGEGEKRSTGPDEGRWWGKFEIGPGKLRSTDKGLQLSGKVAARCRDARPLYTLFGVGLPKWAQEIFRLKDFRAAAAVVLGPQLVEVRRLVASGGKFTVAGDYRKSGRTTEGAFLVSAGSLAVGIDVAGGRPSLKVADAKSWFEGRRAAR